jgi:hypothetical protein
MNARPLTMTATVTTTMATLTAEKNDDDDDDDVVVGARRSAFSDLPAESSIKSVGASDAEEGSGLLQPQLDWSV